MPTGTRIRDNNVMGIISNDPLTAGAAAFNSVHLPLLSTITASEHAVVTLDPLRQYGPPEIAIVTAHTAAATVATITRGAYGTTAREHPKDTVWIHTPVDQDFIEIATSGTRPSDPYKGQLIYETDTSSYNSWNGSIWANSNIASPKPAVEVYNETSQDIDPSSQTAIIWEGEYYDTDNMWPGTGSVINFNTAGWWAVSVQTSVAPFGIAGNNKVKVYNIIDGYNNTPGFGHSGFNDQVGSATFASEITVSGLVKVEIGATWEVEILHGITGFDVRVYARANAVWLGV